MSERVSEQVSAQASEVMAPSDVKVCPSPRMNAEIQRTQISKH
jgi:hypothetical protein